MWSDPVFVSGTVVAGAASALAVVLGAQVARAYFRARRLRYWAGWRSAERGPRWSLRGYTSRPGEGT